MTPQENPASTAVRIAGVSKSFGATAVLDDINLELKSGEVHALIGENGAGKSTLGKIIGGYYTPDVGTLDVFGEPIVHWNPRRALAQGIAMIHQELQLVPDLSVADNVFLGIEDNYFGILRRGAAKRFDDLAQRCGFSLEAHRRVADLRIADRQKVEIMRAIARNARVIIMDEPTSSLTADEARSLHTVIAGLTAGGATVVYITHFLDHVIETADRVTVMRDGRIVKTAARAQETKASLIEAMLGEPADVAFPQIPPPPDSQVSPVLAVTNIVTANGVKNVSFAVRPGEIVGLVGLVGSGRSETARAIFGVDRLTAGEIRVDGQRVVHPRPKHSIDLGIALVPEDRRKQGLVLTQRARANMSLPHLKTISRWGITREAEETTRARSLIAHLDITPVSPNGDIAFYSGGNQQKVLLAKWLYTPPRIIILDEPSRGVDIGARRRIHDLIVELAEKGTAVVLISSEIEEVSALSHRCCLMSQGRIIGEVDPHDTSAGEMLRRLLDVTRSDLAGVSAA